MAKHILKIDPEFVPELISGEMRCQIRKNDRDYRPGDSLELRETRVSSYSAETSIELKYTGFIVYANVLSVLYGGRYGLAEGYVALSISVCGHGVDKALREAA